MGGMHLCLRHGQAIPSTCARTAGVYIWLVWLFLLVASCDWLYNRMLACSQESAVILLLPGALRPSRDLKDTVGLLDGVQEWWLKSNKIRSGGDDPDGSDGAGGYSDVGGSSLVVIIPIATIISMMMMMMGQWVHYNAMMCRNQRVAEQLVLLRSFFVLEFGHVWFLFLGDAAHSQPSCEHEF